MYESPVNIVYNQMRTEVDNHIFKAIVNVGVDVNKEELIKAMQYDRGQYEKGYKDGYDDSRAEIERLNEAVASSKDLVERIHQTHMAILEAAKAKVIKEYIEKASIKLADNARSDYWRWMEDVLHEVEREMMEVQND